MRCARNFYLNKVREKRGRIFFSLCTSLPYRLYRMVPTHEHKMKEYCSDGLTIMNAMCCRARIPVNSVLRCSGTALYNNKTSPSSFKIKLKKSRVNDRPFRGQGQRGLPPRRRRRRRRRNSCFFYLHFHITTIAAPKTLRIRDLA